MSCKRETVHICIVHLLRHSLDFVSYKDRKLVAAALKDIYRALCRRRRDGLGCLRGGRVGPEVPGHRPELATGLGRGRAVLRLPRRGSPDPVHHKRHRGPERHAAPGRARPGPLPDRRGRAEAALPGFEPLRKGVEDGPA